MNLPSANNFVDPTTGTHTAICYGFVDLGTHEDEYQGRTKMVHQVMIRWELPAEIDPSNGRPLTIGQFYTWSMSDKANLRKHLEAWRNKPFTTAEIGPNGTFDIKNVLGQPCTLVIGTSTTGDRVKVVGVGARMKGIEVPPLVNPLIYVALNREEFNSEAIATLSDRLQEQIKTSPEYRALTGQEPLPEQDQFSGGADADEIPF